MPYLTLEQREILQAERFAARNPVKPQQAAPAAVTPVAAVTATPSPKASPAAAQAHEEATRKKIDAIFERTRLRAAESEAANPGLGVRYI